MFCILEIPILDFNTTNGDTSTIYQQQQKKVVIKHHTENIENKFKFKSQFMYVVRIEEEF